MQVWLLLRCGPSISPLNTFICEALHRLQITYTNVTLQIYDKLELKTSHGFSCESAVVFNFVLNHFLKEWIAFITQKQNNRKINRFMQNFSSHFTLFRLIYMYI